MDIEWNSEIELLNLILSVFLALTTLLVGNNVDVPKLEEPFNTQPYVQPISSTLYPPLDLEWPTKPLAQLPKAHDKPRKDVGGSGLTLKFYDTSQVVPTWSIRNPLDNISYISQYFSRYHTGIDLPTPQGTPVKAVQEGVVLYVGWETGYGYTVVLEHFGGFKTRYAHASKLLVKKGQTVKEGETIMLSGNTGNSTGPHLHFEVIYNNQWLNPYRYLHL